MKDILVGGVKVTILGEDKYRPQTEVLFAVLAHGRTRSKKTTAKFAQLLLESVPNLVCAIWDLPNHGERLIDENANASWHEGNAYHMIEMQAIIDQGSAEAASILSYAPCYLPDLKVASRVIIGTSLGGYIAWRVATDHTSLLTAAVPIISSPDVLHIMDLRWRAYKAANPDHPDDSVAFPESVCETMKINAAKTRCLRDSPLPILAICGGDDPLVPPECTTEWGENITANHRVEVVPGVKHEVPREMIDLTAEYLIGLLTRID